MLQVIPLKSTKQLSLQESLTKWIDASHPHYSSSQCREDIARLHSLHSDLANCISISESGHALALSNRGLEDLIEYHACLVECERRGFPTSGRYAEVNGSIAARIEFWWMDAFVSKDGHDEDSLSVSTKSHFHYERACVLWNIAALYTYRASQQDWSTINGRTIVHSSYLHAARILNYVRTELLAETPAASLTSDLSPDCLSMVQSVCLAQGQLCAYIALKERLAKDPSSTSTLALLAKVAAGVAQHYDDTLSFSQDNLLKTELSKTSKEYGKHCKSVSMLFRARAEYLTSRVNCLKAEYGVEIGRLGKAADMCKEGLVFIGGSSRGMKLHGPIMLGNVRNCIDSLLQAVEQRKNTVIPENASIYHEQVPDSKSLENIKGQNVVVLKEEEQKILPIELMPECLERPFFASLPEL